MVTGWRYRIVSLCGVVLLTMLAVLVANHELPQSLFTTHVPVFNRLDVTVLSGSSLYWAMGLSVAAVAGALIPLYKPQPRRVLDTIFLAQKRIIVGGLALSTLGYFNWSYRLPRATLVMTIGLLLVMIPVWLIWIRHRPDESAKRALIVGDDPGQIDRIAPAVTSPIFGYLCPTGDIDEFRGGSSSTTAADGGVTDSSPATGTDITMLNRLGGLSRLEDILVEFDIDTVVLAFRQPDRAEFFGTLDVCHEHGVDAKTHREYADSVLVSERAVGDIVTVDIEPWDPLDHLFKRGFDLLFATIGLVLFAPLMLVIALAITLDSPGPVLYSQDRTAGFGETFPVYKFRTMVPEGESAVPSSDTENDRITRVGRFLRKTHLDELPQLWSILCGDMSVVGPRAAWTEEEVLLEEDAPAWRKRWFVKPGLTGLAQVNGAKSTAPQMKLRYDLEYIRRQSFWLDLKLVIRQCWGVVRDLWLAVWR
ncbi:sugar transferase [Natrialba magadii ATCC 43099]|uniref:Exopolysaccharide biosynthesis polyprenyl glycosylphosphotransferase n=1 Tax=Natrialba magadii (strain ATCC 43099 / DSM 3394 / CCM 3739 / CIP 104546 / IAM 13178 / JCM 8861 / NBRC 102185 / NCIMB 2190 / MS3) TaxID=547559 RepID=D3SWB7_NATMM|nr:sugar transferase [Natrialba magadii]ADD03709.1 sugar transferase [Natrialba magadii ATCC 43099]ELY33765.1 exopolysaccharide biosynthesis polyprenyl glycosylphosphotransferase [Natrialba magadii ATCC 43099]